MKILYIEDEQNIREQTQRWFLDTGHQFLVAADAVSGYQIAVGERPEVILIDLMMDGLDGLELAIELSAVPELQRSLRLAVTAADNSDLIKPALAAGCAGYIFKPFTSSELLKQLMVYLNSRRDTISDAEAVVYLRSSAAKIVAKLKQQIAERDRQYQELQKAQEQLIRTERLVATGQLGLRMAHELNNPLQAVQNSLELIRESLPPEVLNPELARLFDIGRHEIKRASTLASSLLDVHTPNANRQASVDWVEVIADVASLIRPVAERYGVRLEIPTERGHYVIKGVYADMHQIIRNLAQNGLDALRETAKQAKMQPSSERGPATLRIALDIVGDDVQINVIDNGQGLSADDIERLSQLFYTTRSDGHGIGLYVCSLIARANHARLRWYNNPTFGATFELLWPFHV